MTAKPQDIEVYRPLAAAGWMVGSIISFSSMAVAGRALASDLDTFELMLYRSLIGIVLLVTVARMAGTLRQVTTRSMHLQVIRNVSHFTGQNLWFWALTMIPLAQLFAVEFTSPLWVAVLAPLLLGERLTRVRALAAVMGFAGVLIVARPDFANVNLGLLGAAGAAIGFAGSAIFTKLLMRTETITCILFWLVVLQAIFALVISGADGHITWPAATSWPWLAVVGAAGLVAHFCLTRALSLAPAVVVIPFDFARLPVIVILGVVLYDEPLQPFVLLGGAVILLANWINIRAEGRRVAGLRALR
jgi:drug/metabolite transporter (DMT)-like permease